jgi:hypothetical protein
MPGLLNWIRASRQRKRERLADERAHLSDQEKREVDRLREAQRHGHDFTRSRPSAALSIAYRAFLARFRSAHRAAEGRPRPMLPTGLDGVCGNAKQRGRAPPAKSDSAE